MNAHRSALLVAATIVVGTIAPVVHTAVDAIDAHVAAAKAAAGQDYPGLFNALCSPNAVDPSARGAGPSTAPGATPAPRPFPPDRSTWHAEPVKVFDNLYWLGQTEVSTWAVTTPAGIIVIDTIYDYAVEDEVVAGLKKLGLDPSTIKYAIVSHGHRDHAGGAKYLQDHFGTRVILSAADWDLLERTPNNEWAPKRDMVATDGQKLTLGGTTLTMYLTPGHTPGTISTLVPVKDGGKAHLAAAWGGTLFDFPRTVDAFGTYITSVRRFRDIATKAGADVVISNHTNYDASKTKLPLLAVRRPGDPNRYVVGQNAVERYMTVLDECAQAASAVLQR